LFPSLSPGPAVGTFESRQQAGGLRLLQWRTKASGKRRLRELAAEVPFAERPPLLAPTRLLTDRLLRRCAEGEDPVGAAAGQRMVGGAYKGSADGPGGSGLSATLTARPVEPRALSDQEPVAVLVGESLWQEAAMTSTWDVSREGLRAFVWASSGGLWGPLSLG
jgi:hypothetical protein